MMLSRKSRAMVLVAVLSGTFVSARAGQTFVWNGTESDSPTVAANWQVGGAAATSLPGAEDTIRVDAERTLTFSDAAGLGLLRGVSEVKADGKVVCTGSVGYDIPASVSVSGTGSVHFVAALHVILANAGSAFSGQMLFSNNTVYVNQPTSLGTGPVTFFAGDSKDRQLRMQCSGTFANEFYLDAENNTYAYTIGTSCAVTNTGLLTCHANANGCVRLDANANPGASLTILGGIADAPGNAAHVMLDGTVTLAGGRLTPANGLFFANGSITVATPLDCRMKMGYANVTFTGENLLNGNDLELVYSKWYSQPGSVDLNGYSQSGGLISAPWNQTVMPLLTSTRGPATLTFSDAKTYSETSFRVGGQLSMDVRIPWHNGTVYVCYFGNEADQVSDTTASLICRGGGSPGWMRFRSTANFPKLAELQVIGGKLEIQDGAKINRKVCLSLEKDANNKPFTFKLAGDLTVKTLTVNGVRKYDGTYTYQSGGSDFMSSDSTGTLTVRSGQGTRLLVR